jgi:hypothetical protein
MTTMTATLPQRVEDLPGDLRRDLAEARKLTRRTFNFDAHMVELWHQGVKKGERVFLAGHIGGDVVVTIRVPQDGSPAYFFCTRKRKAVDCSEAHKRFSF